MCQYTQMKYGTQVKSTAIKFLACAIFPHHKILATTNPNLDDIFTCRTPNNERNQQFITTMLLKYHVLESSKHYD